MTDDPFGWLFDTLPRQGPGSEAGTLAALEALGPLPDSPRVVELGCGSGSATLVLARALGVTPVAIDLRPAALEELSRRAEESGLTVETRLADFSTPTEPPASVDLLWSEGAVYEVGFERTLAAWRPCLRLGAHAAVSECTWFTESPSDRMDQFWAAAYPDMAGEDVNRERARRAGYEVLEVRRLPSSDWWDYYKVLEARLEMLEARDVVPPDLADEVRGEIEVYRAHGDEYGYAFYLLEAV